MSKRIGVVGLGKRFKNVYYEILNRLGFEIFVWNRTTEKVLDFSNSNRINCVDEIEDLNSLSLDLCISFVPQEVLLKNIIDQIDLKCPILIETPVTSPDLMSMENIGVLEQWPFMPTEIFKDLVYESGLIKRPYWVYNDGRSFDYHAIAQLRKYCLGAFPETLYGKILVENHEGFVDKQENMNNTPHEWLHGQVNLNNGSLLSYSFAYNCKQTPLIPHQLLRAYSKDGAIQSGRTQEMDNDYEQFEVRYLNEKRNVVIEKVQREQQGGITKAIFLEKAGLRWENKFFDLNLDDHQLAIAYLINAALDGFLYSTRDAFIDFVTMNGLKQSHASNTIVGFR